MWGEDSGESQKAWAPRTLVLGDTKSASCWLLQTWIHPASWRRGSHTSKTEHMPPTPTPVSHSLS